MNVKAGAVFLVAIGTLQMAGDLSGLTAVKAIGAASHASPAPKVFTAQQGLETFSARFFIDWSDAAGERHSVHLTPELYRNLRGPYNRRNPYGATIAFAPQLAANPRLSPVLEDVTRYAFCGRAPLLTELRIPRADIVELSVRLEPVENQAGIDAWATEFPITCL
jgi:hypothetical protein